MRFRGSFTEHILSEPSVGGARLLVGYSSAHCKFVHRCCGILLAEPYEYNQPITKEGRIHGAEIG